MITAEVSLKGLNEFQSQLFGALLGTGQAGDGDAQRFIKAAQRMQEDGWWWTPEHQNNRNIRRQVLKEMLRLRWA